MARERLIEFAFPVWCWPAVAYSVGGEIVEKRRRTALLFSQPPDLNTVQTNKPRSPPSWSGARSLSSSRFIRASELVPGQPRSSSARFIDAMYALNLVKKLLSERFAVLASIASHHNHDDRANAGHDCN
jgi:hypothetical protein